MDDDAWIKLSPVNFFQYSIDCHQIEIEPSATLSKRLATAHYQLPNLAPLCNEEAFAQVYTGWNTEGLAVHIAVNAPFTRAHYPEITRGDSIEIMIDTRDIKTSGYNTRFCHRFFCFAEPLEGIQAGELTHFRSEEESHPLCDGEELVVKATVRPTSYNTTLLIPTNCLVGYDPASFGRLGFTYRVNRTGQPAQHFSAITDEFQIEQQPSLWASLELVQ
jgi:hypothetical protein